MHRLDRAGEIAAALEAWGHRCALVGGLAVSIRARERFTNDLDLAVAVASDEEAEHLAVAMQRRGFELMALIEQEDTGRIATLRFADPRSATPGPAIDLIFATCGIEAEVVALATGVELSPGRPMLVARLPHLIAMKVLSASETRPQDRDDLQVLFAVASDPDIEAARRALEQITARGYGRGKDLAADFETLRGVTPQAGSQ